MADQRPIEDETPGEEHHWLSPVWYTRTRRHANIYGRYQAVRIVIDFCAAFCFVAGSILFLKPDSGLTAAVLFLVGSLCFAVKPTIDLVRAFHLKRL